VINSSNAARRDATAGNLDHFEVAETT